MVELAAGGQTAPAGRWWPDFLQLCLLWQIASSLLTSASFICWFVHTCRLKEESCLLTHRNQINTNIPAAAIKETAGSTLSPTQTFQRRRCGCWWPTATAGWLLFLILHQLAREFKHYYLKCLFCCVVRLQLCDTNCKTFWRTRATRDRPSLLHWCRRMSWFSLHCLHVTGEISALCT